MLILFETIRKIETILIDLKEKKTIIDYRLILKLNMSVNLFIVTDTISDIEFDSILNTENIDIDLEKLTKDDLESDEYYRNLFNNSKPIDLGLRRSLSNIIEYDDDIESTSSCPIVSFYSYKGGVGRTTALALFASHYAMHNGKKVFIIDCDFEAPGLINFYGIRNDELAKNGLVEYIVDKEAAFDINLKDNYIYEVSRRYSGDGEIYLMPAGNVFDDADRFDYLEALARLDFHSTSTIANQLKALIIDINNQFSPDVILIDSRTGFNDVFGIIANKLSNIVVGFFGNNIQNKPGLHFFLNTLLRKKRYVGIILVLSIIQTSFNKELKLFINQIDEYIQSNVSDALDNLPALPSLYLSRDPSLEKIGTENEDADDFITLIQQQKLSDYLDLFGKIEQEISAILPKDNGYIKNQFENEQKQTSSQLKQTILTKLSDNFPETYADNINFNDSFINSEFYFRKCMEDIFNHDKFLLLGGKGTGKTAFYQALREDFFSSHLRKRAQKQNINYQVINIISLENDTARNKNKFIDSSASFPQSEITDPEYFYKRFWVVYIWNAIRLDDSKTGFKSKSNLEVKGIYNDDATTNYLKEYILDKDLFSEIENDLYDFDNFLKAKDFYVMIIFDRLDNVVKPNLWSNAVSPLIRYCRTNNFNRILPKLFVRRDLFSKIANLTNKESLEKQAINLEWQEDELFAFFFKVIFAHCQNEFFDYLSIIKSNDQEIIKKIKQKIDRKNSYNQLSPDKYLLKPLVESFFGKYADTGGTSRYGEMYDWIYRNLKNADSTISLRPFLDLIRYAIKKANESGLNKDDFPILSPKCITKGEVRAKAVERHFKDLASEEGNEVLSLIINDIRNNKVSKRLKISSLFQKDFEKLMHEIIQQHKELQDTNTSFHDLEKMLTLNGIISVSYAKYQPYKKYTFAYLYHYYLGLRSPKRRY